MRKLTPKAMWRRPEEEKDEEEEENGRERDDRSMIGLPPFHLTVLMGVEREEEEETDEDSASIDSRRARIKNLPRYPCVPVMVQPGVFVFVEEEVEGEEE